MMLLFPRRSKFMKSFSNKKITISNTKVINKLKFAKIGLIAKQAGFIPNFQMEAIRIILRRIVKKKGQIFFRIFPNQPITKKPNDVRLGRGKGPLKY